jgi:hypothetical protein
MKIVQSLWTKPLFDESAGRNGGWLDRKYFYIVTALSCLQFSKFYKEVELFTDSRGKYLLMDKLGLPFTGANTCLDDLDHCHPNLWCLSKIYTLSLQQQPFVYADMNIVIDKKIRLTRGEMDLVCQNRLQTDDEQFQSLLVRTAAYLPVSFHRLIETRSPVYNTGLLGGANFTFYTQFYTEVKSLIDSLPGISQHVGFLERDPASRFSRVNQIDLFNTLLEQYLFTLLVLNSGKKVTTCNTALTQPVYHHKMNVHICHQAESELCKHYPGYYYKILGLLNAGEL